MASIRQIRANRQNSQSSTGPSEQGKLHSRTNALKHGMGAAELVFEDDGEQLQLKISDWLPESKAQGPLQLLQLERMAAAEVLIERCRTQETDYRYRLACRTGDLRDLDARVEIARVASVLPRRPERVALVLEQSPYGVEWLLTHWRVLAELLRGPDGNVPVRPLDEERRLLAFDMLGLTPVQRLVRTPLDLPAGAAAASDADLAAHQASVIDAQIARLERFKAEDLAEVDEIDRVANAMGRETRVDPEIRLIRRYLKDAVRERDKAHAELHRLQAVVAEDARLAAEELAAAKARPKRAADIDPSMLALGGRLVAHSAPAVPDATPAAEVPSASAPALELPPVGSTTAADDEGHAAFEAAVNEPLPAPHSRRHSPYRELAKSARPERRELAG